jgi:hypothetical protein
MEEAASLAELMAGFMPADGGAAAPPEFCWRLDDIQTTTEKFSGKLVAKH